jgi:undecaprenyl-diphosphatase
MKKQINRFQKRFFDDTFKQLSALGSYQFHAIVTAMFFLAEKYYEFIFLVIGYFIMKAFAIPIRLIFFESRPQAEEYKNIFEKISASSFPSLHASRIIFLLLFLINFFNNAFSVIFFLSGITILILYSRIYLKRHHPMDVVAGAVFGATLYYGLEILLIMKFA